jgi:predicted outer membrane repeat protein
VSGNTAQGTGGGIRAVDEANLTNSTVSGNTAGGRGGGILAPAAALLNCTVVENIAFGGGGLCHDPGGTFTLRNSIVALNLDGLQTVADVQGDFLSEGHNLIGDGIGGVGFISTDIVGTSTSPIDPKIGALKNNGGPTKTHALLAGSKAIDRGDNSLLPLTDQRGFPRVKDGNGDGIAVVDIGAFER